MLVKKNYTIITIIIFGLVFISGCHPQQEKEKAKEAIPVLASRVKIEKVSEVLEYVGDIRAKDEAMVYPKVNGKVTAKVKEDGQMVNKGEAIIYIDRDEVGLKFEKAPVESPLTGIVGRVYVDIGQNVLPATAIALVVSMEKVKIDLDVPEKYLSRISLGREAEISVDAYPEERFPGVVTKISPVVDLGTRTAPVEITIDNPDYKLKSGMFARVKLAIEDYRNSPVVLKEAIMGREPELLVYVVENSVAVAKKVELGIRQGPYYEVRDGLKEGDLVVIMGQDKLYDRAPVIAEESKE